jgi:hypothetical protein
LVAFSMVHSQNPLLLVDILVNPEPAYQDLLAGSHIRMLDDVEVTVCSREDLISMKRSTGRVKDIEDIEALENHMNE